MDVATVARRARTENFPVASLLFPRELRPHLRAVYGFARLVDILGDEGEGDRLGGLAQLGGEPQPGRGGGRARGGGASWAGARGASRRGRSCARCNRRSARARSTASRSRA